MIKVLTRLEPASSDKMRVQPGSQFGASNITFNYLLDCHSCHLGYVASDLAPIVIQLEIDTSELSSWLLSFIFVFLSDLPFTSILVATLALTSGDNLALESQVVIRKNDNLK